MNYEGMKKWCLENKEKGIQAICFILVFIIGFGAGQYQADRHNTKQYKPLNYTTKKDTKPPESKEGETSKLETKTIEQPAVKGTSTSTTDCVVKRNIASSGKKTYHIKGGAFYTRTNPEQCFTTEAEAQAAGFTKSSR